MPASYAHLFFGKSAINLLPKKLALAAEENFDLFSIGLHGPDIFFYYRPYCSNPVSSFGDDMHYLSARDFFFPAREKLKGKNTYAKLAYLSGFLCHYALDSEAHSYVEKKIEASGVDHVKLENEFDRYLLSLEGKDIRKTDLAAHITASDFASNIISEFFPEITANQVYDSLKGMKFYSRLLNSRGLTRVAINALLFVGGYYKKIKEFFIAKRAVAECKDSNLRLEKLLRKALQNFPKLANEFNLFLEGGEYPVSMEKTFGPSGDYKNIPILPFEEEIKYEA